MLLFGPQAVGKMTVGYGLEKITELKLFHNHMTIELLHPFFGFGSETWRLSTLFRKEIFKAVSNSDLAGIIFTFVWAFDQKEDWDFVEEIVKIFELKGGEVYYVELQADLEERLLRNKTPFRLERKPTKRNIAVSEINLKTSLEEYRLNSMDGEITKENYIKINNTNLSPDVVAKIIKEKFQF